MEDHTLSWLSYFVGVWLKRTFAFVCICVMLHYLSFQDLMNREKRDKIPSMQVSFIDAICTQLYEVIQPTECDFSTFSWKKIANIKHFISEFCTFWINALRLNVFVTVPDTGWHVRVLQPTSGRMSEKPATVETFGWGVWERAGQWFGVIPNPSLIFNQHKYRGLTCANRSHKMYLN